MRDKFANEGNDGRKVEVSRKPMLKQ